ncbi:DUF1120 domain-containing protein [Enterobacter sp. K16B]|uniref:DUF1120 domain-containing protein n=1 Tax=Enterobacter sp. K16B TaxID=2878537 RepID=UPI001CD93202|nr:DUF1120 domain-containing protein [Enterobacter sp. K16B]MCA2024459.1 DUF1120 domain-containing protein [Enterobacter sp. K16B]
MKKIILATAIALCTTSALAAETTVMKVEGTLTSSTCDALLGNGGVFDYGTLSLGELSTTENNKFAQRSLPVTITCTAPTKVGLRMLDNRSESNAGIPVQINEYSMSATYYTYGVGSTSKGVKIGSYGLLLSNAVADGKTVSIIVRNDDWNADLWKSTSSVPRSDDFNTMSFAAAGTTTPVAITQANFDFLTRLVIRDTTSLAITDDTALDGQATMTLVYL